MLLVWRLSETHLEIGKSGPIGRAMGRSARRTS
jgi:hypothetical protein